MVNEPTHNAVTQIAGNPAYDAEMKDRTALEKQGKKYTNCCHSEIDISYAGKCPFCKAPNV